MEGWQAQPRLTMKILFLIIALCLPAIANEQDKDALRKLKSIYENAIASRDLASLKPHLAADFTAVMITADEVRGFDGILEYWKKVEDFLGKDGTYQVTIDPDDSIFEGNIAIAKGRAKEHVVRSGKVIDFTSQWTAIARKEGDAWKIVRIQASIDPIGNPIIATVQGYTKWLIAGGMLLFGLIIGRLLPRRKAA
jgi:ketosteroid isomerase-like protein